MLTGASIVAVNMIFAGAGPFLLGLVNGMQLIIHLPIQDVPFPANVMTFMRVMLAITQFDIMEYKTDISEKVIGYVPEILQDDEEEENLNIWDQTVDLGYESHQPRALLGTLWSVLALYFVKVIVYYAILRPINKKNNGKF